MSDLLERAITGAAERVLHYLEGEDRHQREAYKPDTRVRQEAFKQLIRSQDFAAGYQQFVAEYGEEGFDAAFQQALAQARMA